MFIQPVSSVRRGLRRSVPPVATVMWSMITPPKDNASYKPNHFALLVPRSDVPPASISVSDDEGTDNLDKNTPVNVETDHAADNDTDDDDVNSTTSDDSDIEVDDDSDENHQDKDKITVTASRRTPSTRSVINMVNEASTTTTAALGIPAVGGCVVSHTLC